MRKKYCSIQRTFTYRIEIIDEKIFKNAIETYWAKRCMVKPNEDNFIEHLSLLANQHGFIEDEILRFGVCVRIENLNCKTYKK